MWFDARCFQLGANLACEDIVAYDVILAVVLVESATLAVIDKVILDAYARRTFIGVETPATVVERVYIV